MNYLWASLLIVSISLSVFVGMGFSEKNESIFLYDNIGVVGNNATITHELKIEDNILNYEKSELDKLFKVMRENEERQWRQGDVLVASATILAFFGFASLLTVQFRGKNPLVRRNFLNYIDTLLISIFAIQILQLITIYIIVMGFFNREGYLIIIILMIGFLFTILRNIRKIISLQNSKEIKRTEGSDMVQQANKKYTYKMLRNAKEINKELKKLKESMS